MTNKNLHTITIEGLPEGIEVIEAHITSSKRDLKSDTYQLFASLTVRKIQPRRIVLEETDEQTDPLLYQPIEIDGLCVLMLMHNKIWREVKEE